MATRTDTSCTTRALLSMRFLGGAVLGTLLFSTQAYAQGEEDTEPPATEPPTTEPPAVEAEPPPAPEPVVTEAAVAVEPAAEPEETEAVVVETQVEVAEAPAEPGPSLNVGMGIRTGATMVFNDPAADGAVLRLDDGVVSQLNVRPYFSGQLTESVGFTGNLEITQGSVDILDAIVQVKVADEFQIWVGQHIPAMERNNFNGPFYNNGWNLPITAHTLPFDTAGRDRGFTFWGFVGGGILKYHLSAVDLAPGAGSDLDGDGTPDTLAGGVGNARYAARATLNLLDPENYYYTSGTYYGEQDTLAIGAVIQSQKGVDAVDPDVDLDNDFFAFTADLLFEKNLGEGGTITLEGGYWNLEGVGAGYVANQGTSNFGAGVAAPAGSSYLIGVSWLTAEKVGIGKIQPLAKVQIADPATVIDVGVGYIIDNFNHRWFLNYRYADSGVSGIDPVNSLQIGAQLQL